MNEISDNVLENFYTQILNEQTRLMSDMRNNAETFRDNEILHTQATAIMKAILKFKATRTKIKSKNG